MSDNVAKFRRKPKPETERDEIAVRWLPDKTTLREVLVVARLADRHATVAVAPFEKPCLVVRYVPLDDNCSVTQFEVVEPGQWLAYSERNDMLYTNDDADWAQFYDKVND